ncbi:MAG: DNA/RNA non-specific endonuclease [Bacteroidia bacterium]|jgi:endonuclease G
MKRIVSYWLIALAVTLHSCKKEEILHNDESGSYSPYALRTAAMFPEGFESGTKTSYTAGNVSLGSGQWNFSDALIGTSSSDRKTGSKSARIRNSGFIRTNFNLNFGVNYVTVQHAKYGSTANSSWQFFYSTNNGSSWIQVGSTINTTSTALNTVTFTLNTTVPTQIRISKLSGSGIINIDNLLVDEPGESPTRDGHLELGNPSNAQTNAATPNNYLLSKSQYVLSYNNSRGTANWVAWHMSNAWKGSATRCDCFATDTQLPSTFYRASATSFSGSGFDRGHMCPSEDRDGSSADNAATFLMSNMIPQAPNNNQITWNAFEGYCRTLLNQGNELYIISGGYGNGGTGSNGGVTTTLASGAIAVPSNVWKAVVVLPIGSNDLSRVSSTTRIIAIDVPNTQTASSQPWHAYRTSVDAIEAQTGLDLFNLVSAEIQGSIESQVDAVTIQ